VEHLPAVIHDDIEEHEDAGKFALISVLIAGAVALAALFIPKRSRMLSRVTLILAIWAFSVVARTAWLGGQIRHSEIHPGAQVVGD
jgi:hypothetical protein